MGAGHFSYEDALKIGNSSTLLLIMSLFIGSERE
jgi:hypothetical protein